MKRADEKIIGNRLVPSVVCCRATGFFIETKYFATSLVIFGGRHKSILLAMYEYESVDPFAVHKIRSQINAANGRGKCMKRSLKNPFKSISKSIEINVVRPFRPFWFPLLRNISIEDEAGKIYREVLNLDDVVVEVGARLGGGTLFLSKMVKHVYAFEPNRGCFKTLNRYVRGAKNVTTFNLALGEKDSYVWLNQIEKYDFSPVASIKTLSGVQYTHKQRVKMTKLDSIAFPIQPTCIILDCEGYEVEVLQGSMNMLKKMNKILVEAHMLADGTDTSKPVSDILSKTFNNTSHRQSGALTWIIAHNSPMECFDPIRTE